jgi:hypothetical protein
MEERPRRVALRLTPSLLFAIVGVGFVVFLGIHMIQH